MGMLRCISGKTRKDQIGNEDIRDKIRVAPIEDKMKENHLTWFCYVYRRAEEAVVRRMAGVQITTKRKRGNQRKLG